MARNKTGKHKWVNGTCEHCAMRAHWAGAKDTCARDGIVRSIEQSNTRKLERKAKALALANSVLEGKRRKRAQEIARRAMEPRVLGSAKRPSSVLVLAHRVRQERADIFALILEGHYTSVYQAAVEAGLVQGG